MCVGIRTGHGEWDKSWDGRVSWAQHHRGCDQGRPSGREDIWVYRLETGTRRRWSFSNGEILINVIVLFTLQVYVQCIPLLVYSDQML